MSQSPASLIAGAIAARAPLVDIEHETAFRLLNGFSEGLPRLALDVYRRALVIHDYSETGDRQLTELALAVARDELPWLTAAVVKVRQARGREERNGRVCLGSAGELPRRVREHGVWYAIELTLNRDASFYLDTRGLRAWARETLAGKSVLNTFAYTGSLGVAARAAPAARVIDTDANRQFLALARASCDLNRFATATRDLRAGDFFEVISRLKREHALFDAVFLDPPFFSVTQKGRVDLQRHMGSLIDKVRPLVGHDGWLVLVNNALFVSGAEYHALLLALCAGGYLDLEALIPVPEDSVGFAATRVGAPAVDPAPFNHSTKIAVLRVRRKDGRRAAATDSHH